MGSNYIKKKFFGLVCIVCLFGTFSLPVYAGFFPFLPGKNISPEQYSLNEGQIEVYNQQAIELFEEGHFEEAQNLWEKAIQIMERSGGQAVDVKNSEFVQEDVEDYIDRNVKAYEDQQSDHDDLYEAAVSLFRKQKYVAAKKTFRRLERRIPDYKATRNYLAILEHKN